MTSRGCTKNLSAVSDVFPGAVVKKGAVLVHAKGSSCVLFPVFWQVLEPGAEVVTWVGVKGGGWCGVTWRAEPKTSAKEL